MVPTNVRALLLLLLYCAGSASYVLALRTAVIAVLYSGSGSAPYASVGVQTRATAEMWLAQVQSHVARYGGIGDTDIVPQLVFCDVQGEANTTLACMYSLLSSYTLSAVVAPEIELPAVVALLTDALGIPLVASTSGLDEVFFCDAQLLPPCRQPSGRRFQTLISNGITVGQLPSGIYPFLHFNGVSTMAVIYAPDSFNTLNYVANAAFAIQNQVRVVFNASLPASIEAVSDYSTVLYSATYELALQLRELDPDVIVWIAVPHCAEMADAFWDAKYYPRALAVSQCIDTVYASTPQGRERLKYVIDAHTWFPQVFGQQYSDDATRSYANRFPVRTHADGSAFTSAAQFAESYLNFTGVATTGTQAGVYAGFYLIEAGIALSNSTAPAAIMSGMVSVDVNCFMGQMQMDGNHMLNYGGVILTQLSMDGGVDIVYPASTMTAQLLYPAPTFEERFDTNAPFRTRIEWAVLALSVAWCMGTLFCLAMLLHLRHVPSVRALNWPLSLVTLVGILISNLAVLTWTVQNSPVQCKLRLWVWVLGTACMFQPLVSVFMRILLIIRNVALVRTEPRQRQVRSANWVLIGGQALLCLMFFGITLAWHLSAPFRWTVQVVDGLRPSLNVHDCVTDGWQTFGVALASLLLVLLLGIAVLSWCIRGVQDPRFHRFRTVLTVSFVWVLVLVVIALLQATASASVSASFLFGMRSILLLLAGNLVYLLLLFAAPLHHAMQSQARLRQPTHMVRAPSNPTAIPMVTIHHGAAQLSPTVPLTLAPAPACLTPAAVIVHTHSFAHSDGAPQPSLSEAPERNPPNTREVA